MLLIRRLLAVFKTNPFRCLTSAIGQMKCHNKESTVLKKISFRLVIVLIVVIVAIIYALPTVVPGIWPHKNINLGLDLQGGMHLVLQVDTEKAVASTLQQNMQELRDSLQAERLRNVSFSMTPQNKILVTVQGAEELKAFEALLNKDYRELRSSGKNTAGDKTTFTLDLLDETKTYIKEMAVSQALETIRNRIDQFGVSEPDIRKQGIDRILVQLPGITETQRAKDLIGKTALLEFKIVDDSRDVNTIVKGNLPPGTEIAYEEVIDTRTGSPVKIPYLLKRNAVLTGASLVDARVEIDSQFNQPYVSIKFDKKGARIFEKITEDNVNNRLAIVLDNNIVSAPVIQEKIGGGAARITGNFDMEGARDLAIVLRAGSLPAPVTILEERTVGPSLGTDSIQKGILSMVVGSIILFAFMLVYYKLAGLFADIALVLNIIIIAAGLAILQATLTLPGIAGIILTIGMAVDANVIIFERIREELRNGQSPIAALNAGYDRATLTILDANLTTLIAALVLFQFGTGAVKGFAVTLSLGVIASMFTALVVSRMLFDWYLRNRQAKTISI